MKKFWLFALFLSFSSVVIGKTFSLIHYNIKELDSKKIEERSPQLLLALDIIKKYPFDFLSLNELQYDWPGIPYPSLETKGKNLDIIGQYLGLDFFSLFHSGNTGKRAKKRDDGLYWPNLKSLKARRFADPINFGIFPAVGSRFFITYCGIPDSIFGISTYPLVMVFLLRQMLLMPSHVIQML